MFKTGEQKVIQDNDSCHVDTNIFYLVNLTSLIQSRMKGSLK
jgi:hypothetical protein